MLHSRAIIPLKIGQRSIGDDIVRNTLGFFLYIFNFVLTALVLASFNLDLISALGASASAIGNVGPAFGAFGPTDSYALLPSAGKWLLSFCMLLGRLRFLQLWSYSVEHLGNNYMSIIKTTLEDHIAIVRSIGLKLTMQ